VLERGQEIARRQQPRLLLAQPHQHLGERGFAAAGQGDDRLRVEPEVIVVERFAKARGGVLPADELPVHPAEK